MNDEDCALTPSRKDIFRQAHGADFKKSVVDARH